MASFIERLKKAFISDRSSEEMTEKEKQMVEQNAAITIASADMTCLTIFQLVGLKKLSPAEALAILANLAEHNRGLAILNKHIAGMELVYHQIADRIEFQSDEFQQQTGTVVIAKKKPNS